MLEAWGFLFMNVSSFFICSLVIGCYVYPNYDDHQINVSYIRHLFKMIQHVDRTDLIPLRYRLSQLRSLQDMDGGLDHALQTKDEYGNTLLHVTAYSGYYMLFRDALHLDISPHLINERGKTVYDILNEGYINSFHEGDWKTLSFCVKSIRLYHELYPNTFS